jgi:type IV secretory pathway component VirB8
MVWTNELKSEIYMTSIFCLLVLFIHLKMLLYIVYNILLPLINSEILLVKMQVNALWAQLLQEDG